MRYRLSSKWLVPPVGFLVSACVALPCASKGQPQGSQAQQDQSSVAEAARRSREQKKNAAKQSKIISNEDLDLEYYKPGQEGYNFGPPAGSDAAASSASTGAVETPDQVAASANKETQPKTKDSEEATAQDEAIKKLKEQIAKAEDQLKWQERDFALNQDTVYSNPNYTDYQTGKAKLESQQQRINEMQAEIDVLKANLATLQERREREHGAPQNPG